MKLPPAYYPAIGEFMFRYAQLENQLHEIVWHAFDLNYPKGRILTIGTDARVLIGMVQGIANSTHWIKNKTTKQEMNAVAKKAKELYPHRNLIAHGSWQGDTINDPEPFLVRSKDPEHRILPRLATDVTFSAIHKWANELRSTNERARRLLKRIETELPTSYKILA